MAEPTDVQRRLVAVFAADVEGYSRLMGVDEVGTLRGLTERRVILDKAIADHRGRIANTAGDSVLSEFGSAVDAVQCAVEAQAALTEANASLPTDKRINFRIGIHVGDVMIRAGDLFGDGVNIAARLQALAQPGCVCISGVTYDHVRKVLPIAFTDLGAQQVKNIEEPVRAYGMGKDSEAAFVANTTDTSKPLPLPDKPSIAVLPFQNMSGDPEQEYFADGMVEEIITALSRNKQLFVIARNSSFTFKGRAVDIKQVARNLGVRYVLEGSVRKSGNRIRITGQLIDAASGAHLWADRYGALDDVFELQDQVASSVVGAIAPSVSQAEMERAKRKPTSSLDAYDYYLRAQSSAWQYTREATDQAIELCEQAIALDPQFAPAYARLAVALVVRRDWGWSTDPAADTSRAITCAERALRLDKNDALVLALSALGLNADPKENVVLADSLFAEAIRLNPNGMLGWLHGGIAKNFLGEPQEGIYYFQRALRLSPLDPNIFHAQGGLAGAYFLLGRYEEGLKCAMDALRHHPKYLAGLRTAMACHAMLGNIEAAQKLWQQLALLSPTERVSGIRKRGWRDQESAKFGEAYRIAGMPE